MGIRLKHFGLALLAATVGGLATAASAIANPADPLTRQAVALYHQGQLQQAINVEEQAVKERPTDWLPPAALAFFRHQQGNPLEAVNAAKKAAALSPRNEQVLANLAAIQQTIGDFDEAAGTYEQLRRVAPGNWISGVGTARGYIIRNRTKEGMAILNFMLKMPDQTFEWYHEVGEAFLKAGSPEQAVAAAKLALKASTSPEEKQLAQSQLLLANLKSNSGTERENVELKDAVFQKRVKYPELYVRAASALLPVSSPDGGTNYLSIVNAHFRDQSDADLLFRIGKVFEQKSVNAGAGERDGWLKAAAQAFSRAIELDGKQGKYHLALAGIRERQGDASAFIAEVKLARSLDAGDSLAKFLAPPTDASRGDALASPGQLTYVKYNIATLSCACKVSRVEATLRKIPGVAFSHLEHQKPYNGTLLVDLSVTPLEQVFDQCSKTAFAPTEKQPNPLPPNSFEVASKTPVSGIGDAIEIAQRAKYGEPLKFTSEFKEIAPVMPSVLLVDEKLPGNRIAGTVLPGVRGSD